MLRLRLSALESVVHALRAEMFAVKHALGPWYRPEVQPELLPEERSEDLQDSTEAFERRLAEELATQPAVSGSDIPSLPTSGDPTDIASYFPPAEGPLQTAPARHSRHRSTSGVLPIYPPQSSGQAHPHGPISPASNTYQAGFANSAPNVLYGTAAFQTPGQTSGMSYSQGTSFGAASHAAISIPPLDPMKPLPDTFATLHSSLATLAGALGALAATRSAESLRTTEEMRGLRAATHGLRMQVRLYLSTYVPAFFMFKIMLGFMITDYSSGIQWLINATQVHDILTSRSHLADASGISGRSANNGDNNTEPASFNPNTPAWLTGYGPRPYGMPPMHHPPPPFGIPSVPPPINITKL